MNIPSRSGIHWKFLILSIPFLADLGEKKRPVEVELEGEVELEVQAEMAKGEME